MLKPKEADILYAGLACDIIVFAWSQLHRTNQNLIHMSFAVR